MKKSKIENRKSKSDPRSATACRRNSKELPSPELLKEKLINDTNLQQLVGEIP